MAVNEYSDNVLSENNKNHQELMFVYDRLNNKNNNLKSTAAKVEKINEETKPIIEVQIVEEKVVKPVIVEPIIPEKQPEEETLNNSGIDISFMSDTTSGINSNEKILELHKLGKANVAIAKELGRGVGVVK